MFDGVHLGHRAVLADVVEDDGVATVLTFDPHPVAVVAPEHAPSTLTSLDRRVELFAEAGVELTAIVTFDDRVRSMSPEAFCLEVLVGGLGARRVVVGADFHFGKDRAGSPDVLAMIGRRLGFEVSVLPLVGDSEGISSSAIRAAIAAGSVDEVTRWLGRHYRVVGTVVVGDGRGVGLGFPTANIAVAPGMAIPGRGVYAVEAHVDASAVDGVANVGVRPTFGVTESSVVEVHLLDFDGDLYGKEIALDFVARLRDEVAFSGVEALVQQISLDVAAARAVLLT
jgi:riboflavin kinase/FMN adenylyltransferase